MSSSMTNQRQLRNDQSGLGKKIAIKIFKQEEALKQRNGKENESRDLKMHNTWKWMRQEVG